MFTRIARAGIVLALLSAPSRAQAFLWEIDGDPVNGGQFGYQVTCIGDIDGDGAEDFVVADPFFNNTGVPQSGAFYVYSGRTQSLLWSLLGTEGGAARMGESIARLGDVDGDGFEEFAITSERGHADVYSAKLQTLLYSIQANWPYRPSIAASGDVDLDGVCDLLIGGASGYSMPNSHAYLYSGKTGAMLYDWPSVGGQALDGTGDVNGDGVPDVIIGDPDSSMGPHVNNGAFFVYSGIDGSLIRETDGGGDSDGLGAIVHGGHDIDGDGVPDYLAVYNYPFTVQAYSGATGSPLTSWTSNGSYGALDVDFAPDIDGDGVSEILFAEGIDLRLISGRTGLDLYGIPGVSGSIGTGDVNGDGGTDILVGEYLNRPSGSVVAWSAMMSPAVTGIQPSRADYRLATNVTITGSVFLSGSNVQVFVGGTPATNVVVVDDLTITCTVPPGPPGPADVVVQDDFGSGTLAGGYVYTPAVLWSGDASPGGKITIEYECDPFDGIFAIVGLAPQVNIPTPPFHGELCIAPFTVLFVVPTKTWPYDSFWLTGTIPNDPSYSGVHVLLQALIGPSFSTPKDATWTNCSSLTIK